MMETPGKKRKRNAETNPFLNFSEQTFSIPSSTPIHNREIDGSAFENPSFRMSNKENYNMFSDSCMEIKSIADLAGSMPCKRPMAAVNEANPFEVIRKPPKKKKKQLHSSTVTLEDSCFENPGLNLAAAEKQPVNNPFEVPRDGDECKRKEAEEQSRCFVNNALNIRGADGIERFNPFEIVRPKEPAPEPPVRDMPVPELAGIENPALEMPAYAIAVPFTPSLKHRINFQDITPNVLTPCRMLANMVVCSPDPSKKGSVAGTGFAGDMNNKNATVTLAKRRSLSVISEESDIGEKLDCYQLELENSINEARARKQRQGETTPLTFSGTGHRRRSVRRSLIDIKHISNLSQKLHEMEDEDNGIKELASDTPALEENEEDKENKQPSLDEEMIIQTHRNQMTFTITKETTVLREEVRIDVSNPDVQFEEVDDFEDEEQDVELMHNPAPFQRAYRKKEPLGVRSMEELPSVEFKRPPTTYHDGRGNAPVKSHKVRDAIRRSFRRLIPKGHSDEAKEMEENHPHSNDREGHGLISSIRHSLRRRPPKAQPDVQSCEDENKNQTSGESPLEMSIIAEQPRAIFRQPSLDQYKPIVAAPSGGETLRNSLRRSTKDIRKQMMKSVFRKQSGELDGDHGQHVGQLI
ncbi:uncharacterized protein LOC128721475 [Anopheles nili]|uniref:uncharacterized protein LOC128721475 n=1 Tax=Anopheles nili TaxID=185578 RepID=UPI00237BE29D|nr:uncharacterized protein LOC128721475 [Anopheles nili]